MSLSEKMLRRGCAKLIDAVHGEAIRILSGPDAGKDFFGVVELTNDLVMTDGVSDVRARINLHFSGTVPNISKEAMIRTADGKRWRAIRNPQNGFLSEDFELVETTVRDA